MKRRCPLHFRRTNRQLFAILLFLCPAVVFGQPAAVSSDRGEDGTVRQSARQTHAVLSIDESTIRRLSELHMGESLIAPTWPVGDGVTGPAHFDMVDLYAPEAKIYGVLDDGSCRAAEVEAPPFPRLRP